MQRKDYRLIAGAVSKSKAMAMPSHEHCANRVALALAEALGQDNPKFDEAKFLEACKLEA